MAVQAPQSRPSAFFEPGAVARPGDLAILHLRRDQLVPIILGSTNEQEVYTEGAVTNTRFGSFPHSSLLGREWGSQIRASKVDTGGRLISTTTTTSKKRKHPEETGPVVVAADTGFAHLLAPTPENWTVSLPHRTQVVYTPDSSYILQRMRVGPGSVLLEAGAGSGSFTHAAARAVVGRSAGAGAGRIYSFEYHASRAEGLRAEIVAHGLDGLVSVSCCDVYEDGFGKHQQATAVFLDLPEPWRALRHLTREAGPMHAARPVHFCSFSPCIEQVQTTVAALRALGWSEVDMVEVAHRRLDVRREKPSSEAASVDEAVKRLRALEQRQRVWHEEQAAGATNRIKTNNKTKKEPERRRHQTTRDGTLIHRTEPEVKTHSSYLVFAVLPQKWTDADEEACLALYGKGPRVPETVSRGIVDRAEKKEARRRMHDAHSKKTKQ